MVDPGDGDAHALEIAHEHAHDLDVLGDAARVVHVVHQDDSGEEGRFGVGWVHHIVFIDSMAVDN